MPSQQPPIVALDIGTHKIRVLVGEARQDNHLMITGLGECLSRGVRKGEIVDLDNALACTKAALKMAEQSSQVDIHQVYLLLSGAQIQAQVNRGQVPVRSPDRIITHEDISDSMNNARAVSLNPERQLLHSICQHFYVDDQAGVINPKNMEGSRLSLDMLILHGVHNRLRNTARVAEEAQLEISDAAFSGLCTGLSVLTPEQKEGGAVVIDLGAGTTDYVIYADKMIAHAGSIAVGGDHLTNDIALGLNLPHAQAEILKTKSGSAELDLSRRSQTVALPPESGFPGRQVRLTDLHTIIHARMEEIFGLILIDFKKLSRHQHFSAGIILTGGGAHLRDVDKLAARMFNLPCHFGRPKNVSGLAHATDGPDFAAPIGMLKYGMRSQAQQERRPGLANWLKTLLGK